MSNDQTPTMRQLITYHRVVAQGDSGHREWSKHTADRLEQFEKQVAEQRAILDKLDRLCGQAEGYYECPPGHMHVNRTPDLTLNAAKRIRGLLTDKPAAREAGKEGE